MSLITNNKKTKLQQELKHRSINTVPWPKSKVDIPLGIIFDAINRGSFGTETINSIKDVNVKLSRKQAESMMNEAVHDMTRMQIGLCLK